MLTPGRRDIPLKDPSLHAGNQYIGQRGSPSERAHGLPVTLIRSDSALNFAPSSSVPLLNHGL